MDRQAAAGPPRRGLKEAAAPAFSSNCRTAAAGVSDNSISSPPSARPGALRTKSNETPQAVSAKKKMETGVSLAPGSFSTPASSSTTANVNSSADASHLSSTKKPAANKNSSSGPSLASGTGAVDEEDQQLITGSGRKEGRSAPRTRPRTTSRRSADEEETTVISEEEIEQRAGAQRIDGPQSSSIATRSDNLQNESQAATTGLIELEAHLVEEDEGERKPPPVLADATPVEESSSAPPTVEPSKWRKCGTYGAFLLLLGVIGVLVAVFVPLGSSSSSSDNNGELGTEAPTPFSRNTDTDTTTGFPTMSPTSITISPTLTADRVDNLITSFTTDMSLLQDETSPQGQAYQWIKGDSSVQKTFSDEDILDRYALAVLYYGTNGNSWSSTSSFDFLLPISHCEWYGVTCNSSNRPVNLTLSGQDLDGTLSPEIGLLSSLTSLDLKENLLTGSLPSEIGLLTNLEALDLSGEDVPRTFLPPAGGRSLQSDSNKMIGTIPSEIGSLTHLTELNLFGNSFRGRVPSEIGSLTALSFLALDQNVLTGALPLQLGFLTNLVTLSLDRNDLTGQVPNVLCSSVSLLAEAASDCISVDGNGGGGEVQCGCCNICCGIQEEEEVCVDLTATASPTTSPVPSMSPSLSPSSSSSSFSSTSPPSASPTKGPTPNPTTARPTQRPTAAPTTPNPTPLSTPSPTLRLTPNPTPPSTTVFDGMLGFAQTVSSSSSLSIPSSPQYQAVEWLAQDKVDNNSNWSGYELLQRYVLRILYLSTNGENWRNFASTSWFGAASVCEWGSFNAQCNGNGQQVDELRLWNYNLQGTIPDELGLLTSLTFSDLGNNQLTGTIPSQIGQLTALWSIGLSDNQLTGTIPATLTQLTNLKQLYLQRNNMTGQVPSGFCDPPFPDWRADGDYGNLLWADCMSEVQCDCCDLCSW